MFKKAWESRGPPRCQFHFCLRKTFRKWKDERLWGAISMANICRTFFIIFSSIFGRPLVSVCVLNDPPP